MDFLSVVNNSEVKFDYAICFKYLLKRGCIKQGNLLSWAKAFFCACNSKDIDISPEEAVTYYDVMADEAMLSGLDLPFYRYGDKDLDGVSFRTAVLTDDSISVPGKCFTYARDLDVQDLPSRNRGGSTISLCSLCRNSTKNYRQDFCDYEYQLLRFFCASKENALYGMDCSPTPAKALFSYSEDITAEFPDYVFKECGPVILTGLREYATVLFSKKFDWNSVESVSLDGRSPIERTLEMLKEFSVKKVVGVLIKSLATQGIVVDEEQWGSVVSLHFDKINARLLKTKAPLKGFVRNIISEIANKRSGKIVTPKKPAEKPDEEQVAQVDSVIEGASDGAAPDVDGIDDGSFTPEQMPDDVEFADKEDEGTEVGEANTDEGEGSLPAQRERHSFSLEDLSLFHHVKLSLSEYERLSVPSSDNAVIAEQLRKNKELPCEVAFFDNRVCIIVYDSATGCYHTFALEQIRESLELSSIFTGKGVLKLSWESTLLYGILVLGGVRPRNILSLKEGDKMIRNVSDKLPSALNFYGGVLKKRLPSDTPLNSMAGYRGVYSVQHNYFLSKKLESEYEKKCAFCTILGYSMFRRISLLDDDLLFLYGEKGIEYQPLTEIDPRREGVVLNYSLETSIKDVLPADVLVSGLVDIALKDKFRTMDIQLLRVDTQHNLMTIFCGLEYENFFKTWLHTFYQDYAAEHSNRRFHIVCTISVYRGEVPTALESQGTGGDFKELLLNDALLKLKTPDVTLEVSSSRIELSRNTTAESIIRGEWKAPRAGG